jgi:hypothetical protein
VNSLVGENRGKSPANRRRVGLREGLVALPVVLSAVIAGCSGCADSSTSMLPGDSGDTTLTGKAPQRLLEGAIDKANRQEEYPSGEMLQQVVDQLNQWIHAQKPKDDWKLDPLVATLPATLAELPAIKSLDQLQFPSSDGFALREAVWLRNVSRWARGSELDDLSRARHLFDWTIRNIQLEAIPDQERAGRIGQMPWETLYLGRGTGVERAWVFILLARQQGLDAALLALPNPVDPAGRPGRLWAVGVLTGDNVYLFDPALGMPLPAPDGIRLDEAGSLEVRPATLAQLAADDSLLRRLDLDQQRPYMVRSSDLDGVVALIEASPAYLARRMKLVESRLVGQRSVVLSTSASAQVERWKTTAHVADARLWTLPYETLWEHEHMPPEQFRQRSTDLFLAFYATYATPAGNSESSQPAPREDDPFFLLPQRALSQKGTSGAPLRRARILHLKGINAFQCKNCRHELQAPTQPDGCRQCGDEALVPIRENGAIPFYQETRPSDEQLATLEKRYHQMALKEIDKLPERQRPAALGQLEQAIALLRRAKQDASYWLGLMNFDLGLIELERKDPDAAAEHYQVAIDYLLKRTLEASPDGPWTHGATYNLARCYEATRQYDKAIAHYAADPASLGYHGNMLRARWLSELRRNRENEPPEADSR